MKFPIDVFLFQLFDFLCEDEKGPTKLTFDVGLLPSYPPLSQCVKKDTKLEDQLCRYTAEHKILTDSVKKFHDLVKDKK